jgi:hypothetical protein
VVALVNSATLHGARSHFTTVFFGAGSDQLAVNFNITIGVDYSLFGALNASLGNITAFVVEDVLDVSSGVLAVTLFDFGQQFTGRVGATVHNGVLVAVTRTGSGSQTLGYRDNESAY